MTEYKEDAKVRLWASLVKAGRKKIGDVPKRYRAAVIKCLERPSIY